MAALTTAAIVGAAVVGAGSTLYQINAQKKNAAAQKRLQEEQMRKAREEAALAATRDGNTADVILGRDGRVSGSGGASSSGASITSALTSNRVGGLGSRGTTVGL